jgi:hypothetical protein
MVNEETLECFVPFSERYDYFFVEFVEYRKDTEGFSNIMVVNYNKKEHDLYWDDYNFQYVGKIECNGKLIEGCID